ncbi:protein canopy 4 [Macrobrachium rosenbergii]|uniref:protein canopy 4 n=1 Tax=Macrobrachium rosenbergii TaxID=79674 RepID=UPI0034D6E426
MEMHVVIGLLFIVISAVQCGDIEEEKYGVIYATDCEVCKLVTKEVSERLQSTDSSDVIETGYSIDGKKKKTKYNKSELRLVETLEEVCNGMLDYRIHKERKDSTRFAKKMSQTFQTLHNLVNKGVKVDLGMPYELWDEPSAEISHLKTQCERFIEDHEDRISDWYFGKQKNPLKESVCKKVLRDKKCLDEPNGEDIEVEPEADSETQGKRSRKGDMGKSDKSEL